MTAPDQTNAEVSDERLRVDELAQEIRRVNGNHDLGAGALAEALMPFLNRRSVTSQASEGAEPVAYIVHEPSTFGEDHWFCDAGNYAAKIEAILVGVRLTPLYASPSKRVERLETLKECASIAQDCPGIVKPEHSNVDPFWQGVAAAKVAIMQAIQALQGGRS